LSDRLATHRHGFVFLLLKRWRRLVHRLCRVKFSSTLTLEVSMVERAVGGGVLRWGILSPAKIAREKVVPGLRRARRCDVVAIASRDPDRARQVADELEIPKAHGSYEALLADPEVDAVYIPLPNHLHAEWTIAAARAGKHVLCEKPIATNVADAERMVNACERAGVRLMEAFMYRLHPSWVATVEVVDHESGTACPARTKASS